MLVWQSLKELKDLALHLAFTHSSNAPFLWAGHVGNIDFWLTRLLHERSFPSVSHLVLFSEKYSGFFAGVSSRLKHDVPSKSVHKGWRNRQMALVRTKKNTFTTMSQARNNNFPRILVLGTSRPIESPKWGKDFKSKVNLKTSMNFSLAWRLLTYVSVL